MPVSISRDCLGGQDRSGQGSRERPRAASKMVGGRGGGIGGLGGRGSWVAGSRDPSPWGGHQLRRGVADAGEIFIKAQKKGKPENCPKRNRKESPSQTGGGKVAALPSRWCSFSLAVFSVTVHKKRQYKRGGLRIVRPASQTLLPTMAPEGWGGGSGSQCPEPCQNDPTTHFPHPTRAMGQLCPDICTHREG